MRVLYCGLEAPESTPQRQIVHCPLIRVEPRKTKETAQLCQNLDAVTHLIFTSKSAVRLFFDWNPPITAQHTIFSLGPSTSAELARHGSFASYTADDATAEGVVELLSQHDLSQAHVLWPHSALSRSVIPDYLHSRSIPFIACVLYDTFPVLCDPIPALNTFDEIVFTSSSTVSAFFAQFTTIPPTVQARCIGPITKNALLDKLPSVRIADDP